MVIPSLDARDLLARTLESLEVAAGRAEVVVVDNDSHDGTARMVADRFPAVTLVRNDRNLGFGRAVNRGVAAVPEDVEILVLVNNDVVCEPGFVERICAPFDDPSVGMVAGVLLQEADPTRIDSAGIELDRTLRSFDLLCNEDVGCLASAPDPVGPCGGAAAYRLSAFRQAGGFDEAFFAYWEDVDLALRLRLAGWECRLAPDARAVHRHGATLGAMSPAARRLDAFGRSYVLHRYRVGRSGPLTTRLAIALVDWPALLVHLVVRREVEPLRARLRGRLAASRGPGLRAPLELATVPVRASLARQWRFLADRLRGRAPGHFSGGRAGPENDPDHTSV